MIQLSSAMCRSMMGRNEVQLSAESINFIFLYDAVRHSPWAKKNQLPRRSSFGGIDFFCTVHNKCMMYDKVF